MNANQKIKKFQSVFQFRENIVNQIKMKLGYQIQKRVKIENEIKKNISDSIHNDRIYEGRQFVDPGDINVFFRRKKYLKIKIEELRVLLNQEIEIEKIIMGDLVLANQKLEVIKKIIEKQKTIQKIQIIKKERDSDDEFLNSFIVKNQFAQGEK